MVAEAENQARGRILVSLAIAGLGWFLFRELSIEWRVNPQYSYGWVVPLLAVYLVWRRWEHAPTAQPRVRYSWLFGCLLFLLLPVRLVQEANPDWRLASWAAALAFVGIIWVGLMSAGGQAWWKHFAFATAFILIAVPWPTPIENVFVQSLMRWVAAVAVEVLNWLGVAAQQEGNLIRLSGGTLGVDEACSGVRSFQATLMVALFFGEVYRLTVAKRILFVGLGGLIALTFNFARAIALAIIVSRRGLDAIDRWHDPAGYVVLIATFVMLALLAKCLRCSPRIVPPPSEARPQWPWCGATFVIAWLLFCEVTTAAWYRSHETNQQPQRRWAVDFPYDAIKIPENVRLLLRFNEGEAALWNRRDGSQWHLFFFHWKPGRAAANLARNHRPEACLPATGFEFVRSRGVKNYSANGIELPIERLEFANGGEHLQVYYCLWEDRAAPASEAPQLLTRANRVRAVLEGRRHLGQRVLEVVIVGMNSPEAADEAFGAELPKWIKIER